MIPKLKPCIDKSEIKAILNVGEEAITKFEEKFASTFKAKYALTFQYGRSAIFVFLKSQGILKKEIVMPAYTCVVVSNATVLSGNIPKFIDISLKDFNMDMGLVKKAITKKTKAIIATNLFGYPCDIDTLKDIVKDQFIIQDSALAFGTKIKNSNRLISNEGDATFYATGIGKQLCTFNGGIITTNKEEIYLKLKRFRDKNFKKWSIYEKLNKLFLIFTELVGLNNWNYNLVYFLWKKTRLLHQITQYYREDKIDLPKDYNKLFTNFQARIGLEQLKKLPEILEKRKKIAEYYDKQLKGLKNIILPPIMKEATYSHYVPRIKNRKLFLEKMAKKGINVGYNFEYSIPYLKAYNKYKEGEYKNSLTAAKEVVNIPNYPSLTNLEQKYIVESIIESLS